ncbi:MFS transporter [soil metagenome]
MANRLYDRKQVWSWAFYDWANSAFATTVAAVLFPAFFSQDYWQKGVDTATSTSRLGIANSSASIIVALLAPMLGAVADRGGKKKFFLTIFTIVGVLCSIILGMLRQDQWFPAIAIFLIANVGFNGALSFYDAMLVDVSPDDQVDYVSALGFSVGYLGGGLLLAVNVLMINKPAMFGLADSVAGVKWSFISVGIWWAIFSIPLLAFVREHKPLEKVNLLEAAREGFVQVKHTFLEIRRLRNVLTFLIAYLIYIDGVNSVIRMAVKFGKDLDFPTDVLIKALLLTQFVAFPAALAFGHLGKKLGPKTGILIALSVYVIATILATQMTQPWHFYGLSVAIGLVQGGVQSLSRSFFARLIPADKAGEFFGFYNMLGKAAAFAGPLLMALAAVMGAPVRYTILALVVLFVGGGLVLLRVPEDAPPATV